MSYELTYASPGDPLWKRLAIRAIENLSGRRRLLPLYREWSALAASGHPRVMSELLDRLGTRLDITAPEWPPALPEAVPLVMIANHPFGIGDGVAILALAEQLGRPYRVLINSDFLRVPAIRRHALPIDFSGTRKGIETNLKSRNEARQALRDGITLVVFPAGGVATADRMFGKAEELPWKSFTARLVQEAQASVLPVYFEGQNSPLFQIVSRYSLTLRLALLVSEVRRFIGATLKVHAGAPIPFEKLEAQSDRTALTEELYVRVQRLSPGASALTLDELRPTAVERRRRYPWDPPARHERLAARSAGKTSDAF